MTVETSALTVQVPVIHTERLVLRAPRGGDLDALAAFYASPRSRWVGGPCTRFDAWMRLTAAIGHWILRGFGMWTVETREAREVAGRVGLLAHDGWPEPELGWHLFDGFEGRGLAHEAALAARRAARELFGRRRPISLIDPDNLRSRRLAERLGARVEREDVVLGHPCLVYRHPAEAL